MIKILELNSGVKLILDNIDSVKSVSIGIFCRTGSVNEKQDEYGISHFIEHMLFKGTKNRSPYQIVQEMDSIGAEINAFTSREKTCFYAKVIDENLFQAADVLVDMIENPLFDRDEMEKEKLVVIEEINMNADDPDDVAMDEFDKIVLNESKLAHPVLGYKDNIISFNHDFLCKYYYEHYTKDNLIVSVSGSFDEKQVIEYFENKFLNLNDKCRCDEPGETKNVAKEITITKDIEQAHIVMGLTTVPVNSKYRYMLSVLSIILGGGMSSRLFQTIREEKGLAYSIYSSNSFYKSTGEFGIVAGVAKDRVDEFLDAIKIELDKLDNEKITQEEFDRGIMQLKTSYIFSLESTLTRMRTNGTNYLNYGRCYNQDEQIKLLDSITLKDVEESKKIISDYSKYSVVVVTGK